MGEFQGLHGIWHSGDRYTITTLIALPESSRMRARSGREILGARNFRETAAQERRYLIKAAIPRARKTITRSHTKPIPHIIPIGILVICIMFETPVSKPFPQRCTADKRQRIFIP